MGAARDRRGDEHRRRRAVGTRGRPAERRRVVRADRRLRRGPDGLRAGGRGGGGAPAARTRSAGCSSASRCSRVVYELAAGYARHALFVDPGSLPGATWAAWASHWLSPLSPLLLVAALLLFPDGRLPTPRWRWVLWLCGPLLVLVLLEYGVAPGPARRVPARSRTRWAIEGAEWLADARLRAVRRRRSSSPPRSRWSSASAARTGSSAAGQVVRVRRGRAGRLPDRVGAALRIVGDDSGDDSIVGGFVFAAVIAGCRSRPASRSCATGSTTSTS